jgi:hypothetical protein
MSKTANQSARFPVTVSRDRAVTSFRFSLYRDVRMVECRRACGDVVGIAGKYLRRTVKGGSDHD